MISDKTFTKYVAEFKTVNLEFGNPVLIFDHLEKKQMNSKVSLDDLLHFYRSDS